MLTLVSVARAQDHLTPRERGDAKLNSYFELLNRQLGDTAFNCGRYIDSSWSGPELLISVYSVSVADSTIYYVTSARPAKNLWQATHAMHDWSAAHSVKVSRRTVPIPKNIAEKIRCAWKRMLDESKPSKTSLEVQVNGYTDFLIQSSDRPNDGQMRLPPEGRKTRFLARIAENLVKYCDASSDNRDKILMRINADTDELINN